MIQITNLDLATLDKQTADFYKLSARYFFAMANLHGRKIYKEHLETILKKADKIIPETEFDNLVLRNIQSNLKLHDLTVDYLTEPKFSMSVKTFFDKLAGEGAFSYMEEKIKSPPWEKRWVNSEKNQERDYLRVNPFVDEAQKSAREWLPRIKQDILEYGKSEGYFPLDFDMSLLLLPPKDGMEYSNWNSKTRVFSLGSYGFEFFPEKGGVIAVPTRAYCVAFHEILGHGAHQLYSEQMPFSIKSTEQIGVITPTKSVTEGVAINAEKLCYDFLRQRINSLGLSETDITLLEEEKEIEIQSRIEHVYYSLIKDKELREKKFDSQEYLLNLTQNPVIVQLFEENFKGCFFNVWNILGHALGPLHYQNMLDKAKQELTAEQLKTKAFHRATLKGVWSREIYPEAVVYLARTNGF